MFTYIIVMAAIFGIMYLLMDFMRSGWGADDEDKK